MFNIASFFSESFFTIARGLFMIGKSANGRYENESEDIKEIRNQVFSPKSDGENLRNDQTLIKNDARKAFNKVITQNG